MRRALSGHRPLFKKREFSWIDAVEFSAIITVPVVLIFGVAALYAFFVLRDMEKTIEMFWYCCGLISMIILITKGALSYE
jgi:hypothetical protein